MKFKISSIFLFICFVSISTFAQTNSNSEVALTFADVEDAFGRVPPARDPLIQN